MATGFEDSEGKVTGSNSGLLVVGEDVVVVLSGDGFCFYLVLVVACWHAILVYKEKEQDRLVSKLMIFDDVFVHIRTRTRKEDAIVHQNTYLLTVVDCWVLSGCQENPSGSI